MSEINFSEIEKKWQDRWEKDKVFEAKSGKNNYYVLEMFPYPSGKGLHMGHALNYVIGDVLARYKKMKGFNVLHPMGYDALGLPAENAAILAGEHPEDYTNRAIENYIRQQKGLGISYDWSRMINTASPEYYKWDQWIFLKMLEKNLAYQKESAVNWCRECDTVLANEQVHDGKCWRHEDLEVEVKNLKQWFFKTTQYAEELYDNLDNMTGWPERTRLMQKNWIGKSHGTEIDFEINGNKWNVFTTRPDTLFGVTFLVVASTHSKLDELVTEEERGKVDEYLSKMNSVSEKDIGDMEKEGVFTGSYATNPSNEEKVPIYAGNFVVADYGSGMVMGVPAHDQRDYEFAKKYKIEIRCVIEGDLSKRAYTGEGNLINSGEFSGMNSIEAKEKITSWLEKKNVGRKKVNYKLRDWGVSRQRYWGVPIPIVYCDSCGVVAVTEKDLPIVLPRDVKFGKGNPLETAKDWIKTSCPKCSGNARRSTETLDTFANSSWYFLRYCDPNNSKAIFDPAKVNKWCPVDFYIGGAEHACMHLIYSRFYIKFLRDLGLINFDEPSKVVYHQGMLMGEGGIKMSKSKGNVVNPEDVSKEYGIDTARYFLLSLAAPDKDRDWSEKGIRGSLRFVKKILCLLDNVKIGKSNPKIESLVNKTVEGITKDIEEIEYRAATIKLKTLFDALLSEEEIGKKDLGNSLKILSPFCPHIAEELWERLENKGFVTLESWPKIDSSKIIRESSDMNLTEKITLDVRRILDKTEKSPSTIYLYVVPFEFEKVNAKKISKELKYKIKVFAVNDSEKYDPENKSKRAKAGR
ncbi:MAG: leucine--tRNA ligase, partial [Nanoarchaeota archaeon]|nr:leucine--tRNA ligase [Nanoarchaeota archaeon]